MQGRVAATIELLKMNNVIIIVEPPSVFVYWCDIPYSSPIHCSPVCCTLHGCQDCALLRGTRCWCNRWLELRLRQYWSCRCNKVRYELRAACGNGPLRCSNERVRRRARTTGSRRRERKEKGSMSVRINCFQWQSSTGWLPALHQTRVSLCMWMRVHPFVHPSVQKLTSKYSPIIYLCYI